MIIFIGLIAGIAACFVLFSFIRRIPDVAGAAVSSAVMPSGDSTPYETDYSYEMAMAIRGDTKGALASFEDKIGRQPSNVEVKLKAAQMYADAGNSRRARDLYREVQRQVDVPIRDDVFASYRLIDLYRGPLAEPAKSLSEFRRLIDRYPDSEISRLAGDALANLKKEMKFE